MSPLIRGLLRPALNTAVAAALAALVVVAAPSTRGQDASVRPHQAPAVSPGITLAATVVTTRRERVMRVARAQIGDPYVYGASGPRSFDCSGLTMYSYRVGVGRHLPHSSSAQQGSARRISASAARPGDLVFFHSGGHVYHVAIYAGHHTVIHAPYPGARVRRERIWTSAVTYGRVV